MINLSEPFTVNPNSDVIVVQLSNFLDTGYQAVNGGGIPTINWITSSGTQTLLPAAVQQSAANAFIWADDYYWYNPTLGSGTITVAVEGRYIGVGAFTLSGVNTGILPVSYGHDGTTGSSSSITTSASTVAGSYAAVDAGYRSNNPSTQTVTVPATGVAQVWSNVIGNIPGGLGSGGQAVSLPTGGTNTITASCSSVNNGNRNEIAVAVFAPITAKLSTGPA